MLIKTFSSTLSGVTATTVTIEIHTGPGMKLSLIGLAAKTVQESIDRVQSAIRHNKFKWPRGRLVINMAPAGIRKLGSGFDLSLGIGILAASKQIRIRNLSDFLIVGELSLDGSVQAVPGVLPMAIKARKEGFKGILLPQANAEEAAIVDQLEVIPIAHISEAIGFLEGKRKIAPRIRNTRQLFQTAQGRSELDYADVKGQVLPKRGLEIAAAGGHHLIMVGPPGSGKSMLAKRFPTILPPLNLQEALETTMVHSVAGALPSHSNLMAHRPFRAPHHTISNVALVGGGSIPRPGEISLAHNGVLFLDELTEFKRPVIEVLRQPLENGSISISRARQSVSFPARFSLIGAFNPCPCGLFTHPSRTCGCSPQQIKSYMGQISAPLMDRIDLQVEVMPVPFAQLTEGPSGKSSAEIRAGVRKAREIQEARFTAHPQVHCNAMMDVRLVRKYCDLCPESLELVRGAIVNLGMSARAYDRILKVSRTIADLAEEVHVLPEHVAEALSFRSLDRENWADRNAAGLPKVAIKHVG